MALNQLVVFNKYAYGRRIEMLNYNIALFNAATLGGMVLVSGTQNQGDFVDETYWKNKQMTRRRDAYSVAAISAVTMEMGTETSVKVDAGTYELQFYQADMRRILQNPKGEGVVAGEMMAQQLFADMVNTALGAYCAASANQPDIYQDFGSGLVTWPNLVTLQSKFGDRSGDIKSWIMNSKNHVDLLQGNLTNTASLFSWAGVNVIRDVQGRPIIVTDAPSLIIGSGPPDFYVPGLTPGAIRVEANDDFNSNEVDINGKQQIMTSYQAEWSFNLKLKGYSWDKATGGKSPNDAALFSAGNWDRTAADKKDLGGVLGRFL